MPKTGNYYIDSFSTILVFAPLVPAIIVLSRKAFHDSLLNFLMVLCLLQFIGAFIQQLTPLSDTAQYSLTSFFSLIETLVYIQIFRPFYTGKFRDLLNFLVIVFLSSLITYYLLNGTDKHRNWLMGLQSLFVLSIIGGCLPKMIRDNDLNVFRTAFFWIASGSFFYLVIAVLVELADHSTVVSRHMSNVTDKAILLDIANLVRYIFFTLAALMHQPKPRRMDQPFPF